MEKNKKNQQQINLSFQPVVKYIIWFYILAMLAEMLIGGMNTIVSMQKEANFIAASAKRQVDYRVNQTIRLLHSLAKDATFRDPSTTYPEKAAKLTQYSNTFEYMMICIVDQEINVWDEQGSDANLGGRAYMQRLFATGETQVTDSFAAGSDGVTLNYTIAVPMMENKEVKGALFAAIYFDEIDTVLKANAYADYQELSLWGGDNQVMSFPSGDQYGKTYLEMNRDSKIIGTTVKKVEEEMYNNVGGSYWKIQDNNFKYVVHQPIAGTHWTLFSEIGFWGMLGQIAPLLLGIMLFSTIVCIIMVLLAKHYIHTKMGTIDILVNAVQELERKIYQDEKPEDTDFEEILNLTSKGLTDSLTGVITRTVFLNQIPTKIKGMKLEEIGCLCFVDVDDLKSINDHYGHGMGDITLETVGYTLREYEKKYDGLVGRHGGDEFVLWIMGFQTKKELQDILETLVARLHMEITSGDTIISVHCSVGVAIYEEQEDIEHLIEHADQALYLVKQHEKGTYQIYKELC